MRWKAPNNPTAQAKQVWQHLWPTEPWPKGWRVEWVGWMRGALGLCCYTEKRILLSHGDARRRNGVVATLVHELLHVRGYTQHTLDFWSAEARCLDRIGLTHHRRTVGRTWGSNLFYEETPHGPRARFASRRQTA